MRSGATAPDDRVASAGRPFAVGFAVGLLVTVPAISLALVVPWGEPLSDLLVPGSLVLRGMSSYMADWPGVVNVALVCLVNGLVYGAVVAAVATLLRLSRPR